MHHALTWIQPSRPSSQVSPDSARAIYAGLNFPTCVSILRRAALGRGGADEHEGRPGSENLEALQTTRLLERDLGGEPDAALAALLLLGKKGPGAKAAAQVLFRFKTEVRTDLMCHS